MKVLLKIKLLIFMDLGINIAHVVNETSIKMGPFKMKRKKDIFENSNFDLTLQKKM